MKQKVVHNCCCLAAMQRIFLKRENSFFYKGDMYECGPNKREKALYIYHKPLR